MKPIKYIEAMVLRDAGGFSDGDHEINLTDDGDTLKGLIVNVIEAESKRAKDASEKVTPELLAEKVMAVIAANLDEFQCALGDHDCEGAPLEQVSHPESIHRQMQNVFLTAELVALVRLSDLERLIAVAKGCRLCDCTAEQHCEEFHIKGAIAARCPAKAHHTFASRWDERPTKQRLAAVTV
jgi:hypothetical protein